ncbi:DNA polymerase III subunit gamma/tau, partial [Novosphingobium sp. 2580]|nr:DNA polymerase III subunit gamma/tau [Novosphingobium album (ex Hu et al. 2023)]
MDDSRDSFGDSPPWENGDKEEAAPSAAELEAAGQSSMFGDPAPASPDPASTSAAPAPQPAPPPAVA